ncbi:oligopeptide transporter [Lineolata rhizophorae]|uniref:Oligopeptide transporter n=1 Tax=Lineolata rhizophorae TaxID=578093 RepID=A0A6A6P652_9PEZI|nr:oligopeptide transporter [Lineolata rhizophorae]
MSNQPLEVIEASKGDEPRLSVSSANRQPLDEKHAIESGSTTEAVSEGETSTVVESDPTEVELNTLQRISGKIPWTAYTIAFVELCERFSYYGTTAVFVNFIQRELPEGSTTGSAGTDGQAGALGMGQRASTGLTTFNQFWSYVMPLVGAYIADEYLGRYNTIMVAIACALVGHVILIVSALPPVIQNPDGAIAAFSVGLVIMGMGTGGFKSNISPLIAEQYKEETKVINKDGKRVIRDAEMTYSRIFLYFYFMINVGSLTGQIGMVYAEKYVGFWLSYLLPTIMFCFCPMVLYVCRKRYIRVRPEGSVLVKSLKVWNMAMKGRWSWSPVRTVKNMRVEGFWEPAKPSNVAVRPNWMTFDDQWVDEVRRGLKACVVFIWYPIYWLAYGQMVNNLVSQAATMDLDGVPNDVINNLNPISLIVFIPIFDRIVYPGLAKIGLHFTPLKRITCGFMVASCAMITAAVLQYYIYKLGPCGDQANSCVSDGETAPINVWAQTPAYVLIGISEIFASITGLEYAFTKAPSNMRSLVMAVYLFQNALSSAVAQALVPLADDPLLIWNYGVVAVLAFCAGCGFWLCFRRLDAEEDKLNMLPKAHMHADDSEKRDEHGEAAMHA